MILRLDGPADVVHQMRADAVAFEAALTGGPREPVLRLFRFEPEGITLGASQEAARELDLPRCEADGIRWAHRPTGGRAIFHADEWTFSLLASLGPGGWAADARSAYARTGALLAAAFVRMGVPVTLARGGGHDGGAPRVRHGSAPPCFASSARHELLLDGRKFAGIAQRVTRGVLLQQGSLLVGPGHERLADYLSLPDAARGAAREALRAGSAEVGAFLKPCPDLSALAAAIEEVAEEVVRHGSAASVHGSDDPGADWSMLPGS